MITDVTVSDIGEPKNVPVIEISVETGDRGIDGGAAARLLGAREVANIAPRR